MLICGLNKTTLLDYPGRVAATIFMGGCNFRCPFCHNRGLVLEPSFQEAYSEEEVLSFLKKRKNVLKGVCITGGEPILQPGLADFMEKIKKLGYQVKLDTNGYRAGELEELLKTGLVDYVAMDIKNCPEKYAVTAGFGCEGGIQEPFCLEQIERSVELLEQSGTDYEFRTTVVKELHTREDILKIAEWIQDCPRYFLQQFRESDEMLGEGCHGYASEEMRELSYVAQLIPKMKGKVFLRGIEGEEKSRAGKRAK